VSLISPFTLAVHELTQQTSPATSAASKALQNATSEPATYTSRRKTSTMPTVLDARTSSNPCLTAAALASMHHINPEVKNAPSFSLSRLTLT
jgi:hypothetical protein